jgi:hypothetical protein
MEERVYSEQDILEAGQLKIWYNEISHEHGIQKIDRIRECMDNMSVRCINEYDELPPEHDMTLKDVVEHIDISHIEEKMIDILNMYVEDTINELDIHEVYIPRHRPIRYEVVCSLDEPFKLWHLDWITYLTNEWDDTPSYEGVMFVDDTELLDESEGINYELCNRGLHILDSVMEGGGILDEGKYIEICNVLKELYRG